MTNHAVSAETTAPPLGLTWGIKRSFVQYVSFIPDVSVSIRDGAEATNGSFFTFIPNGEELDPTTGFGILRFKGGVRISGHGGMMQLQLLDPWISLNAHGAVLGISTSGATATESDGIVLATLELPPPDPNHPGALWQDVPAFLTTDGAALFNYQYPVGQEMDPLFIHLPQSPAN